MAGKSWLGYELAWNALTGLTLNRGYFPEHLNHSLPNSDII